ncbi:MAG: hypothetical protein IRY89_01490 [Pseudolabrys sp.]|nr:hypothetical protein [Pseudolabrys sp.]
MATTLTDDAWAHIRYAYEHTDQPIADICAAHGISSGTLRDRVRRWGWIRRRAPIPHHGPPPLPHDQRSLLPPIGSPVHSAITPSIEAQAAADLAQINAAASERSTPPAGHGTKAIIPPLQNALERVLPAVETTLATLTAAQTPPYQTAQAVRVLGALTGTLRELNEMLRKHIDELLDDIPEDIDEFRENLARRIEAFFETRGDEDFDDEEKPQEN